MTRRNTALDVLRGILLIIITVNHIGGPLSTFTFQPMSFVSSAEGFIFLSGYVLGLAFGKRLLQGQEINLTTILKRSAKIYSYHIATLVVLLIPFFINNSFISKWQSPELIPILENPSIASCAYFLLIFQPEHMDVLPMYILFIPLGLIALKAFSTGKKTTVLLISSLLWIFGQFDLSSIPDSVQMRSGFFNVFGWQFLFILGCFFGYANALGRIIVPRTKIIFSFFLVLLMGFAVIRYGTKLDGDLATFVRTFTDKPNLQFFRLANFLVIAYLIGFIIDSGHFPNLKPLAFLGRHSLQVFSFQIVMVYYYTPIRADVFDMGFYPKLAVQCLSALLLFVPALIHRYYLNKSAPTTSYVTAKAPVESHLK